MESLEALPKRSPGGLASHHQVEEQAGLAPSNAAGYATMLGNICFLGASTIYGSGDSSGQGWVQRFKVWYRAQKGSGCVFNLGIPGAQLSSMAARAESEFRSREARFVVFSPGINDVPRINESEAAENRSSIAEARQNIRHVVEAAQRVAERTLFLVPFTVDCERRNLDPQLLEHYLTAYAEAAEKSGAEVQFANQWLHASGNGQVLAEDGLHLNDNGHTLLADGLIHWIPQQASEPTSA